MYGKRLATFLSSSIGTNRDTLLKTNTEGIPDDHHSKPKCLVSLARLFASIGNYVGGLIGLSSINWMLGLYKEDIKFAKEAWEIAQRIDGIMEEAHHLNGLA